MVDSPRPFAGSPTAPNRKPFRNGTRSPRSGGRRAGARRAGTMSASNGPGGAITRDYPVGSRQREGRDGSLPFAARAPVPTFRLLGRRLGLDDVVLPDAWTPSIHGAVTCSTCEMSGWEPWGGWPLLGGVLPVICPFSLVVAVGMFGGVSSQHRCSQRLNASVRPMFRVPPPCRPGNFYGNSRSARQVENPPPEADAKRLR